GPNARIVDEYVEAGEALHRRVDGAPHFPRLGDVGLDGDRLSAPRLDLAHDRVGACDVRAHDDREGGAARGELERNGAPDVARAARDQGDLAVELARAHARAAD